MFIGLLRQSNIEGESPARRLKVKLGLPVWHGNAKIPLKSWNSRWVKRKSFLKEPEGSTAHNSGVSQSYMYIVDMIIYIYTHLVYACVHTDV